MVVNTLQFLLIKQESITSLKLSFQDLWQIANSVFNKCKSATPPLLNLEVLPSASDREKLFPKNFSKDSNLENSCIPLPAFPFRTNMKLHYIFVTPKNKNMKRS